METNNIWSSYFVQTLAGLTVIAVGGIIAYIRSDKFRHWLKSMLIKIFSTVRWFKNKWQICLLIILFVLLEFCLFKGYSDWKISVYSIAHLVLIVLCLIIFSNKTIILRKNKELKKFFTIQIPPGVGNKYFDKFYIDAPSGDVVLGGVEFKLEPKSLVFDTHEQIRDYRLTDDGFKEIRISLPKPYKDVQAVHVLINSGNSKGIYVSDKIGEIILIFKDAPPVTTELSLGENIREWCLGASGDFVKELSDPKSRVVWQGVNKDGTYAIIDNLEIPIPNVIKSSHLEEIVFRHRQLQKGTDTLGPQFFVSAITLETNFIKH